METTLGMNILLMCCCQLIVSQCFKDEEENKVQDLFLFWKHNCVITVDVADLCILLFKGNTGSLSITPSYTPGQEPSVSLFKTLDTTFSIVFQC